MWTVLVVVFLSGCSSTTKVVEHWTDPDFDGKLENLLVLSLNQSSKSRRIVENGFLLELKKRNIQAQASYNLIPDHEDLSKEAVKAALSGSNIDGVLVMRPVKITKEDRNVRDLSGMPMSASIDQPMIAILLPTQPFTWKQISTC